MTLLSTEYCSGAWNLGKETGPLNGPTRWRRRAPLSNTYHCHCQCRFQAKVR